MRVRTSKKEKRTRKKNFHTRGAANVERNVHAGSYANPAMRKLFGIELPPETESDHGTDEAAAKASDQPKRSKRKVAFLLGYVGKGYSGFQINEGKRTIQGEFGMFHGCLTVDSSYCCFFFRHFELCSCAIRNPNS